MDTIRVSGAETYREPQPLQIGISEQEACPLGTEIVFFRHKPEIPCGRKAQLLPWKWELEGVQESNGRGQQGTES